MVKINEKVDNWRIQLMLSLETNLKKQGLLGLTFDNPADYDKIKPDDRISLLGLNKLAPNEVKTKGKYLFSNRKTLFSFFFSRFNADLNIQMVKLKLSHSIIL